MLSLVVPIYRSEENIPELLKAIADLARRTPLEAVFVIDGSPDKSVEILHRELSLQPFSSRLIELSRNFGAFSAVTAGLAQGAGDYFAMLAADLQEPPEMILDFVDRLSTGRVDVVVGQRISRNDPWLSRALSHAFWNLFRTFAVRDIPTGGVDTFGCTRLVRDRLISLPEVDSSLVSLLFWVGFRREVVPFIRRGRTAGKSAWSLKKKVDYAIHSFFNFSDLPIRLLIYSGALAAVLSVAVGVLVLAARIGGFTQVPGYTALALLIAFYGGVMTFGLGVVGQYVWLTLQNARRRPNYIIQTVEDFAGKTLK
jgi:polyisoprenyl-phosphate glycosyltransferase